MKHYGVFSEAIREGAKLRPQGFGCPDDEIRIAGTSCAIESGIEAMGAEFDWADECALCEIYPYMSTQMVEPVISYKPKSLFELCWLLNDNEKWTRERIADWLSGREEELGFILLTEDEPEKEAVFA